MPRLQALRMRLATELKPLPAWGSLKCVPQKQSYCLIASSQHSLVGGTPPAPAPLTTSAHNIPNVSASQLTAAAAPSPHPQITTTIATAAANLLLLLPRCIFQLEFVWGEIWERNWANLLVKLKGIMIFHSMILKKWNFHDSAALL